MIKQRNQFDNHRTKATAATPTCCCCCCCLTTIEASTLILSQRMYLEGKTQNNPNKWGLVVLAALYWPIVALITWSTFKILNETIAVTRTTSDYYGGEYTYTEHTDIVGWATFFTFALASIGILYLIYYLAKIKNPIKLTAISSLTTIIGFIVEFFLTIFIGFGSLALINDVANSYSGYGLSFLISWFSYIFITLAMAVGLTLLSRKKFIKKQLRQSQPQAQGPHA